jgi:hypothetical protein
VHLHPPSFIRLSLRLLAALLAAPMLLLRAQAAAPVAQPPLASFAAMRVAVVPVQLWHADSVGWSREAQWSVLRPQLDTAITQALRDGGLGAKWAYAGDVMRSARRNPMYSKDPAILGVGRWRNELPKVGDDVSALVADNLRSVSALGDSRHALIPVELRGDGEMARLRVVLADTRSRSVVWAADLRAPAGPEMLAALAQQLAALIIEP